MADRIAEDLLAPLVKTGSRLLRVASSGPGQVVLRFDRGSVEVRVVDGALELEWLGNAPFANDAELLDEAEPWWTVIGQPLRGGWSRLGETGERLRLELELREENPRRIALEPRGRRLTVRSDAPRAQDAP